MGQNQRDRPFRIGLTAAAFRGSIKDKDVS